MLLRPRAILEAQPTLRSSPFIYTGEIPLRNETRLEE